MKTKYSTDRLPTYALLFLLLAALSCLFIVPPSCAAAPADSASQPKENFVLPNRPTPPTPPTLARPNQDNVPAETKPPVKAVPQKQPPPQAAESPPPVPEKNSKQIAPTVPKEQSAPNSAAQNAAEPADDTAVPQKKPSEKTDPFFQSFIKNSIYSIVILAILAFTFYLYWTTPQVKAKRAASKRVIAFGARVKKPAAPPEPSFRSPAAPLEFSEHKLTNKSLLQQLVKYDMETYGQLRSTLDYEQPAYVESLIRQYGGGDANKINRAIHLFYANRNKN